MDIDYSGFIPVSVLDTGK